MLQKINPDARGILAEKERINLAILDVIRKQGPVAKTIISKLTKINIVTVSNYVNDYVKKELVFEKGLDISTGGRRPILIELNKDAGYVVGAGLTLSDVAAVVTDLKGEVVCEVKEPRTRKSSETIVAALMDVIEKVIKKSDLEKEKILGIGVAIPGVVDRKAHTIRCWGAWGTTDGKEVMITVSLEELLHNKFSLPVIVENDADAAVFGERWFTQRMDVKNMLYMYSGVGCGIISNGEIYEGATGNAGELGIINPDLTDPQTWRRNSVELGSWEMDLTMTTKAREAMARGGVKSAIFEKAKNDAEKINPKLIFECARGKDEFAVKLIEEAGAALGRKIAFLVNLLNPEIVIIGGGIEQAGYIIMDAIKKSVNAWSLRESKSELKILPAQLGENAVILGAASIIINEVFASA